MADVEYLQSIVQHHSDFPKKVRQSAFQFLHESFFKRDFTQGVGFLDIFPILRNPIAFETLITHFVHHITSQTIPKSLHKKVDVVVGLDARGFLIGPIIALRLGAAFVPVRKKGKLPGQCVSASYEKEYGTVSCYILGPLNTFLSHFRTGYL